MKSIKCDFCGIRVKGSSDTFDQLADWHGFSKHGMMFMCPACRKSKDQTNRMSTPSLRRGGKNEKQAL